MQIITLQERIDPGIEFMVNTYRVFVPTEVHLGTALRALLTYKDNVRGTSPIIQNAIRWELAQIAPLDYVDPATLNALGVWNFSQITDVTGKVKMNILKPLPGEVEVKPV